MLPRSRPVVTRRLFRFAPLTLTGIIIPPPPKLVVSTPFPFRHLRRPLSLWGQSPRRRPPPTYNRFPLKQSQPSADADGEPPPRLNPNLPPRLAQLQWLWQRNLSFRYGVLVIVIGGSIIYTLNLERVPISGRLHFNCIPPEWERRMGEHVRKDVLRKCGDAVLPSSHPLSRMVRTVLDRLTTVSGVEGVAWEVVVIDAPDINAFVTPGGKVFVFTGILPFCHDADGLAAVLGHEIAHAIAHHVAETISVGAIVLPLAFMAAWSLGVSDQFVNIMLQLAWKLPGSRKKESEADFIGLMIMAKACYNPEAALEVWRRMEKLRDWRTPPEMLSTHPSNLSRLKRIEEWLPKAYEELHLSGCGSITDYATEFDKFYTVNKDDFL